MNEAPTLDLEAEPVAEKPRNGKNKLALPIAAEATPMGMIARAVAEGAGLDVIEKLMSLQERWEKNQGRKAFDEAIAAAKAEIPVIIKNRAVDFTTQKGRTNYRYEDLAAIAEVVNPILAKHGLSYRFRTTSPPNEPITVTCVVSHRGGYSEENTLSAGRDDTGNKNAIQSIGSTLTYLQRMTLKASLGLAASTDDDGKLSGNGGSVSDEQLQDLGHRLSDTKTDITLFLKHYGVDALTEFPAARYDEAVRMLAKKKAEQETKGK